MRCSFLALAGLFCCGAVRADSELLWPPRGQPPVRTFVAADFGGEPQMFSVTVGPSGMLYAGNLAGVLEFDGSHWRAISPPDDPAAFCVIFDGQRIWSAGSGRIQTLEQEVAGRWSRREVALPAGGEGRFQSAASLGALGVAFCAPTAAVLVDPSGRARLLAKGRALRIVPWGGSLLLIYEGGRLVGQIGADNVPEDFKAREVVAAVAAEGGLVLASLSNGLQFFRRFEPVGPILQFPELESGDRVQQFVAGPHGIVAASTLRSGTLLLDQRGMLQRVLTRNSAGVLDDASRGMAFDPQGGLWLASDGGMNRVQVFSDSSRVPLENLPSRLYRGAVARGDGYWIATSVGMFSRDARGRLERVPGSPTGITGLAKAQNELLVTCSGPAGGLWAVARTAETFEQIPGPPLLAGGQTAKLSVSGGWAAIAHSGGIAMYRKRGTRWEWAGAESDTPLTAGTARVALTPGWMWFEHERRGLARRPFSEADGPTGPVEHLGKEHGLVPFDPPMIPGLLRWRDDCYLAAGNQVLRWRPEQDRFEPLPELAGRAIELSVGVAATVGTDDALYLVQGRSVRPARRQRLYRLTRVGVERHELEEHDVRFTGTEIFGVHPQVDDGVIRLQALGGLLLYRVRPGSSAAPGPVAAVRRVLTDGQECLPERGSPPRLELPYEERRGLRFEYSAPWFITDLDGTSPLRYRTRLRGFESSWSAEESSGHREFTSLPAGDYFFEVQAEARAGAAPGPTAVLAVTIVAPWWLTTTARVLYGVAGALLCGFAAHRITRAVFRRRLARAEAARAIETERVRIARDMHDELGSTIGRVAFLSREGHRLAPEALLTRLTQIEQLSREMRDAASGIIWAVNPAHDSLNSFADRISTYFCTSLETAGISARLEIPPELPALPFASSARHQLLLVVKECTHNLVRHSRARRGVLRLGCQDAEIWLEVSDDGVGFDAAAIGRRNAGYGLESLKHRVERLRGRLEIRSGPGEGTTIRIDGIRLGDATG
ncbi:MAG: hypothetical protein JSR82_12500 [Verrucomicrobia bacterium]|nr:hypothetical protein [Verrucomicrobiota bacterium]